MYKNEVDKPAEPKMDYISPKDMGMKEFYKDAAPIAYGQSGEEGCRMDYKKIDKQFKDYYWK